MAATSFSLNSTPSSNHRIKWFIALLKGYR